ncbi:GNAT family N-acetyltransferase [Caballeronia sordidicola]|jgi:GNAT superfamily N-acetyltransferase|uniref:Acetyltransferase, GNAT family n=1 Tax=Caballeronia sordidicola TaxID=196367 RepID=A0A226WUN6_CABSO|nr:GNAT family N-acetyltransferase [Caballeronia sordidicola]OXC74895.1 Acetyltransferase, GNAT family [Caballeronia sordidicola]
MSNIDLRRAIEQDWDFVALVTEACMRNYVEQAWGQWRPDSPDDFNAGIHQIIRCNGDDIGCVALVDETAVVVLKTLYILPAHQNRGIGTALMQRIIERADAGKKSIQLRVLRVNPARRFYERHGFVVTHSTAERHLMTRSPLESA